MLGNIRKRNVFIILLNKPDQGIALHVDLLAEGGHLRGVAVVSHQKIEAQGKGADYTFIIKLPFIDLLPVYPYKRFFQLFIGAGVKDNIVIGFSGINII